MKYSNFEMEEMKGEIFTEIVKSKDDDYNDFLMFIGKQNSFVFYHLQDCCECVAIEDISGNLKDLLESPLTMAEVVSEDAKVGQECDESGTWTFYKFATINGYVTVRWLGESNGWYSEEVDSYKILTEELLKMNIYKDIPEKDKIKLK